MESIRLDCVTFYTAVTGVLRFVYVCILKFQAYFVLSTTIILLAIFGVAFSTVSLTSETNDVAHGTGQASTIGATEYTMAMLSTTAAEWMNESDTNSSKFSEEKMFSNSAREKVLSMRNADSGTRWFLYTSSISPTRFSRLS